jgi:hypothetical protein
LRGWDFCRNHANAIYGIMLGLSVPESAEEQASPARESARPAQPAPRKPLIN